MTQFRLFAIEDAGPRPLPVSPDATQFSDLYHELPLGVYDALRTFEHNKFLYLSRHLARTERSMALLGWSYRLDRPRLLRALHDIVTSAEWPEMRVRIDVLAGPADALGSDSRELIAIQPFSPPPLALYEQGVAVDFAVGLARNNPLVKTAAFAARRPVSAGLAQLENNKNETHDTENAAAVAPYEFLLLNDQRHILEGTGTNFWAVRDGVIYTAGEGVLEGVTREIILNLVTELGIPLRLEAVSADELSTLDEAALSGSSRAFLPIVEIAGHRIGDGRPGPLSRRILAAYIDFVAANVKTAV